MTTGTYLKSAILISMILVVLLFAGKAQSKIIYLDVNATGANNGSDYINAFNRLEDALEEIAIKTDEGELKEIWLDGGKTRIRKKKKKP